MNLFLVDDEPLTAKWVEEILRNRAPSIRVAGKAGDGREALEGLKHCPSDILITDIKMPGMDGLELIRQIKSLYPEMYIIILSSYSDFRFTSEAIRLGADDYLLKSEITEEDLHQALERFSRLRGKQVRREKSPPEEPPAAPSGPVEETREEAWQILTETPHSHKRSRRELARRQLSLEKGPVFCLLLQFPQGAADKGEIAEILRGYLDLLCEKGTVTELPAKTIGITGRVSLFGTDHYEKKILSGIKSIRDRLEREFSFRVFFGLSSIRSSAEDFALQYAEARQLLGLQSFYTTGEIPLIQITRQTELLESRRALEKGLREMAREISLEKGVTALSRAEDILDRLGKEYFLLPADAKDLVIRMLRLLEERELTPGEERPLRNSPSWQETEKLCRDHLLRLKERLESRSRVSTSIEKACAYIIRHYNDSQISLIHVSDHVSLNSTYLSDLFRKEMGITFQDYISRIRLEKTEYLLENTTLSIAAIAREVGFQSSSYLARFFRKHHRVSPREYREGKRRSSG